MNLVKLSLISMLALAACGHTVKVQPITVEPIHMTIDVNVHDDAQDREQPDGDTVRIKR
jgi:hypothetical protein